MKKTLFVALVSAILLSSCGGPSDWFKGHWCEQNPGNFQDLENGNKVLPGTNDASQVGLTGYQA
jgi:hypothetical protein